jgi:hypothetical protein
VAISFPGEVFTFQILFLDAMGVPVVPPDPTIEVFAFDPLGVKVTLVAAGTAMFAVAGDSGRYIFVYGVPSSWDYQPTMYGVMQGTNPATATVMLAEMDVDIIQSTTSLTVSNNGVVVSADVSTLNIAGSGVTVTSSTPGNVDIVVPQAQGRGLIAQFVRGG